MRKFLVATLALLLMLSFTLAGREVWRECQQRRGGTGGADVGR